MMKTEKRKANVGERILITNADCSFDYYDNGNILKVIGHHNESSVITSKLDDFPQIYDDEYEVIIENTQKPSKQSARITTLETQVAELQAKVEALEQANKPKTTHFNATINVASGNAAETAERISQAFRKLAIYPTEFPLTARFDAETNAKADAILADIKRKATPQQKTQSPNEQRADVIKRAKAFVEESKVETTLNRGRAHVHGARICDVEFHVNSDKRTVVSLLRWRYDNSVVAKGIAKCDPSDVFNADIGKAIALGRALGLDVSEFENAVKPTVVAVGQIVTFPKYDAWHRIYNYRIDSVTKREGNLTKLFDGGGKANADFADKGGKKLPIIDDTEAQY